MSLTAFLKEWHGQQMVKQVLCNELSVASIVLAPKIHHVSNHAVLVRSYKVR